MKRHHRMMSEERSQAGLQSRERKVPRTDGDRGTPVRRRRVVNKGEGAMHRKGGSQGGGTFHCPILLKAGASVAW